MIPDWLRVPTREEWEEKARAPGFIDARIAGLTDAVQAGWYPE